MCLGFAAQVMLIILNRIPVENLHAGICWKCKVSNRLGCVLGPPLGTVWRGSGSLCAGRSGWRG